MKTEPIRKSLLPRSKGIRLYHGMNLTRQLPLLVMLKQQKDLVQSLSGLWLVHVYNHDHHFRKGGGEGSQYL